MEFKFRLKEQITDLIKVISKNFPLVISQTTNFDEWLISTRLYPTDRYIEITRKGFENALYDFTQEFMKYISDSYREEIKRILDERKYVEEEFGNPIK